MSNILSESIDSGLKRAHNVPVTSVGTISVKECTSSASKMDNFDTTHLDTDFYAESDRAIAQYTKKLRAEDLKIVTSIPPLMDFGSKGSLDTPEVSLNLSDFMDTPEFNKITSADGLFPQVDLLTSSQEKSVTNTITNTMNTATTSQSHQFLIPIKQEPVDVIEIEVDHNTNANTDSLSQAVPVMETIDISELVPRSPKIKNVVIKQEVPDVMGSYVTIPESPSRVSEEVRPLEYMDYDKIDNVPTPVQDVEEDYADDESYYGKSPPPSRGIRKRDLEKGSDEYKLKRERNNVAVRKSREKARERQRQTEQKVKTLVSDNKQLSKKLELVTKELAVLKGLFQNANLRGLINPQHLKIFDRLNR